MTTPEMSEREKLIKELQQGILDKNNGELDTVKVADFILADRARIVEPIEKLYERFKHLDGLLSNREWMVTPDSDNQLMNGMLHELWAGIKESLRRAGLESVK